MKIEIRTLQDTARLAQRLAALLKGRHALITLSGDLGAGKTTFTKALGKALGVTETINSPTFTIQKSYHMADGGTLFHIDAYRLEGITHDLGFEECFDEGICVIEWSDFIADELPQERLEIAIAHGEGDEQRFFTLKAIGAQYEEILEGLA